MHNELLAGQARRIISPPKGIYLIGYGDRTWGNRGIHDDLTATALALDDGRTRVVVVACDLLAINEITLDRIKTAAGENILLCCSHTHSGPIVYADKRSSRKNKKYIDFLISQIVGVVREAIDELQPARLAWGEGEADIAVNRRERKPDGSIQIGVHPEGVVDRSIGIIQLKTPDGKTIANLVNFSCHNVVLGPKNNLVSADWAGSMRRRIEDATSAPCLFIQGAAADLNPAHEWGGSDWEAVENLGKKVAEGVLSGMADLIAFQGLPLNYHESKIWLSLDIRENAPTLKAAYKRQLSKLVGIPKFLVDTLLKIRYPWQTSIEEIGGNWSIPMACSILQIGDLIWVSLGAEVFTEIGIQLKANAPSSFQFFSSVTNGCIGYLPTVEEYPLGGYEVDLAPFFYRLPGRLKFDSAETAMNEVLNFFGQIQTKN